MGRWMHSMDPGKWYVEQVRVQYITLRKYNTVTETYPKYKIHYTKYNHIHNYTINNS